MVTTPKPGAPHRRREDDPHTRSGRIVIALIGVLLFLAGAVADAIELGAPPVHTLHLELFTVPALFGALLVALVADASFLTTQVGRFVDAIAPIVPWSRARRLAQQSSEHRAADAAPAGDDGRG